MADPIVVTHARIVRVGDVAVDLNCQIKMRLLPFGGYEIESNGLPTVVLKEDKFRVLLEGWPPLEMCVQRHDFNALGNGVKATLRIAREEPYELAPEDATLQAVRFKVLNFQRFQGIRAESVTTARREPSLKFLAPDIGFVEDQID